VALQPWKSMDDPGKPRNLQFSWASGNLEIPARKSINIGEFMDDFKALTFLLHSVVNLVEKIQLISSKFNFLDSLLIQRNFIKI
jgi:hypothetical protein